MEVAVSLKDIVDEMDVLSDEFSAFLNKKTGELVTLNSEDLSVAEDDDDIDGYPEWQQEMIIKAREVVSSDEYLPLPSKFDIHEYNIIENFCYSVKDDKIRKDLLYKIKGGGAFHRFKDAIHVHGIEEERYRFRQEELEKVAIDWLEANQISYTKDEG
ncbi:MAG: UPF0158 family protein [Proteobacteria bacterium]|nr:UPF0158 family protein [Pseudomonadota bacterium]